jgi:hypothetical protein
MFSFCLVFSWFAVTGWMIGPVENMRMNLREHGTNLRFQLRRVGGARRGFIKTSSCSHVLFGFGCVPLFLPCLKRVWSMESSSEEETLRPAFADGGKWAKGVDDEGEFELVPEDAGPLSFQLAKVCSFGQ